MANRTSLKYKNITDMATMFGMSRMTVRKRLRARGVKPQSPEAKEKVYDMALAGPALFQGWEP